MRVALRHMPQRHEVGEKPLQHLRSVKAVKGIDLVELPAAEQCCGFGGRDRRRSPGGG
ncbi:heterodisulfide reductase-related iron-sulfur binding cluster [Gordonia hankookensis]|uniref:heterodisulfide reductase-related iron-sulfur binding cluster n=1 Tax=Gordonia hankookensis TaxID=589403 RepID=UPI00360FBD55